MQHIEHAVISCAGVGSRLGLNRPKCLVELNGRKLIDYQMELLKGVADVRVIVGFKELDVIDYVRKIRPDTTFVRNPDYATTSNSYSLYLATRDLRQPFVSIDGDMIISPRDFKGFLAESAKAKENIIGITPAKTTEAIFVRLDKKRRIVEFTRSPALSHEWCGVAYLRDIRIKSQASFLFNQFINRLPLRSFELACYEIDTPEDLDLASAEAYRLFDGKG